MRPSRSWIASNLRDRDVELLADARIGAGDVGA